MSFKSLYESFYQELHRLPICRLRPVFHTFFSIELSHFIDLVELLSHKATAVTEAGVSFKIFKAKQFAFHYGFTSG